MMMIMKRKLNQTEKTEIRKQTLFIKVCRLMKNRKYTKKNGNVNNQMQGVVLEKTCFKNYFLKIRPSNIKQSYCVL